MASAEALAKLREVITENLRIQKSGAPTIRYIDVTHALDDARARQNHVIFARRGCGKTLLLHNAASLAGDDRKTIYLNCEDFQEPLFPKCPYRDSRRRIFGNGETPNRMVRKEKEVSRSHCEDTETVDAVEAPG